MDIEAHEDVSSVGQLADPVRRGLYDFVIAQHAPVTREEAADGTGITRTLAAYHLDRLADAGLLDIGYARKEGRTGPGSGRPAKRYSRARREVAVSLPPRNYSLLAHILADAADAADATESGPLRASLARAAEHAGQALGAQADDLPAALATGGYEPVTTADGVILLRNCPFHSVVEDHTDLVCALNHAVIRGALTGAGEDPDRAELDRCDGRCCVVVRPGLPQG
ncbi:MAG TPA: helix-turn-helix domain-containing protein [Microbacterium sp.]|nr:helix-turn-helix domain-containing protein [Microbacterium sp.]